MTLTREERETIFRTSDADDHWAISTASPKFIRKFQKLGYQNDDDVLCPGGYRSFKVPLNLVSFRKSPKKQQTVTHEAKTYTEPAASRDNWAGWATT